MSLRGPGGAGARPPRPLGESTPVSRPGHGESLPPSSDRNPRDLSGSRSPDRRTTFRRRTGRARPGLRRASCGRLCRRLSSVLRRPRAAAPALSAGPGAGRDVRRGVDVTVRKDAVLDWLLEASDPGVRFFALRDLLGAPPNDKDLLAARRATVRRSPVRDILGAQDRDGFWVKPGPGYSPKYTGTSWQIIFLGQFGADGENRRLRRGADYVLDHSRADSPYHGFSATGRPDGLVHCLQGNLGAALLELGYGEDPRLRLALDWLARSNTREGRRPRGGAGSGYAAACE